MYWICGAHWGASLSKPHMIGTITKSPVPVYVCVCVDYNYLSNVIPTRNWSAIGLGGSAMFHKVNSTLFDNSGIFKNVHDNFMQKAQTRKQTTNQR